MAGFLIALQDFGNPADVMTQQRGDIIKTRPDVGLWGIWEHKASWIAAGRAERDWPDVLGCVRVPEIEDGEPATHCVREVFKTWMTAKDSEGNDLNKPRRAGESLPRDITHVRETGRITGDLKEDHPVEVGRLSLGTSHNTFFETMNFKDPDEFLLDFDIEGEVIFHRLWKFHEELLTAEQLAIWNADRELTLTLAEANVLILNKQTGSGIGRRR